MRLDVYLSENGYADSRERAKRLILAGSVRVDGVVVKKPAFEIEQGEIALEQERFVGRGGEKLEGALRAFAVDPAGMRAIDIGASTGGFTHCLLLHGAAHVTALDAGCDQLHPTLARDARVKNIEKYNARDLSRDDVGEFDLAVMDVSFISQTYILPRLSQVLLQTGLAITLIKPQFEAGRAALNKKGVVKDPRDRLLAVRRVLDCARASGLVPRGLVRSPITGGDGNVEYLALFALAGEDLVGDGIIDDIVLEGR